jgi:hypothetical protein
MICALELRLGQRGMSIQIDTMEEEPRTGINPS